jgi:hypothetical protein
MVLLHTIFGQADKWGTLRVHTTDGQLAIDNNRVENSLRAIALSHRNYFFAGLICTKPVQLCLGAVFT